MGSKKVGGGRGGRSGPVKWEDDELHLFYHAFHEYGPDWENLATAIGAGRTAEDCQVLFQQFQNFLGLPYQPSFADAFVAMVEDGYKNSGGPNRGSRNGPGGSGAATPLDALQRQRQQKHAHGSPGGVGGKGRSGHGGRVHGRPAAHGAEPGEHGDGGGEEGEEADEEDEEASEECGTEGMRGRGGGAAGGAGAVLGRGKRERKARNWGEDMIAGDFGNAASTPVSKPPRGPAGGGGGGSGAPTPGSAARHGRAGGKADTAAAHGGGSATPVRGGGGGGWRGGTNGGGSSSGGAGGAAAAAPSYGSAQVMESGRKRRSRRLFSDGQEDEEVAVQGAGGRYGSGGRRAGGAGVSSAWGGGSDAARQRTHYGGGGGGAFGWGDDGGMGGEENDELGEGVDALLSLATLAHASSSHPGGGDGGGGQHGNYDDNDDEGSQHLAERVVSGRAASTPRGYNGGYIYRTGTPCNQHDFLVASPPSHVATPGRSGRGGGRRGRGGGKRPRSAGADGGGGGSGGAAAKRRAMHEMAADNEVADMEQDGEPSDAEEGQGPAVAAAVAATPAATPRGRPRRTAAAALRRAEAAAARAAEAAAEAEAEEAAAEAAVEAGPSASPHPRSLSVAEPVVSDMLLKRHAGSAAETVVLPVPASPPAGHRRQRGDADAALTPPESSSEDDAPRGRAAARRAAARRAAAGRSRMRRHRRKPQPERFPPLLQPLRALFSRSGLQQQQQGLVTDDTGPAPRPVVVGETGDPVSVAELVLRHALGPKFRRWVAAEWLYPAVDRPWYLRSELTELLGAAGLPGLTRLTRTEWGVLRGVWGTPRRLSLAFLKGERLRLEAAREATRDTYEAGGLVSEVPPEVPRPLRVGQPVVARHPATRQLHDGIILTIKPNSYRVQFNRAELLTEVVADTDLMPLDPGENLPLAMRPAARPAILNGRATGGPLVRRRTGRSAAVAAAAAAQHAAQQGAAAAAAAAAYGADVQSRADTALLGELGSCLDRKEVLVSQLREMNRRAEAGLHVDAASGRACESFQAQYAAVLAALQGANADLQAHLSKLQARPHLGALAGSLAAGAQLASAAALQPGSGPGAGRGADAATGPAAPTAPAADGGGDEERGVVAALVASAMEEARQVARKVYAADGGAAAATTFAAGADAGDGETAGAAAVDALSAVSGLCAREAGWLDSVITRCVATLLTLQRCTAPGQSLAAGALSAALDDAVSGLRPRAAANAGVYVQVTSSVEMLKTQLARA